VINQPRRWDGDEAQKAQSALLNVRTRLAAEMAWLPGVAPRKAANIFANLSKTALRKSVADLPGLARANVLAAWAEATSDNITPEDATSLILHIALAIEDINLTTLLRDINEDRSIAGFPPVRDEDVIVEELEARKVEYRKAVNGLLDRFPSMTLVKVVDSIVQKGTREGSEHAPSFIQDIVASEQIEFQKSITYSADIGVMFKDKVSISPSGVSWQNRHVALEAVTRIRWGGTRHSINGIPTGTNFMIAIGDSNSFFTINTRKQQIYENLIDRIWRAIGVRLLVETITKLKVGNALRFGGAIIRDDGITVNRHKIFRLNEPVNLGWHQVHVWTRDGNFCIGSRTNPHEYVGLSYQNDDNVPVLENLIRAFFDSGKTRISSLFNS
jgi:hypothetical protein